MAGSNEFKLFCSNAPGTADSLSPAAWAALTTILANGFQTGEASSEQANTAWRQASTGAAVLGELIARSNQDALDNRDIPAMATKLLAALAALLPSASSPGDIKMVGSQLVPNGWLVCDGTSELRATYPALFGAIGVSFGSVDATHFTLPDMRGMFARGYDNGRGVDVGRVFGTYQPDAMPTHVHSVNLQPLNSADAGGSGKVATGNSAAEGVIPPFNTSSTGSGTEVIVKNVALTFCIYTGIIS